MRKASLISILLILVTAITTKAQTANEPEMADAMRSNGKIYVVVLVLATIFAGIIAYLIRIDRKISKLEKNK
ncbi:MAG: CcmD family protein [Bacteroidetes bacterium]|nr:CcmD family protein [Bacteroidota bacterium]